MKWWKDLLFSCSLNNVPAQWVLNSLPHSSAPSQQLQPSHSTSWEFFFLPLPLTLHPSQWKLHPGKLLYPLPSPWNPLPGTTLPVALAQKVRQACLSEPFLICSSPVCGRQPPGDSCKTSFAVTDWHEVTLRQPHFMVTSGTWDFSA